MSARLHVNILLKHGASLVLQLLGRGDSKVTGILEKFRILETFSQYIKQRSLKLVFGIELHICKCGINLKVTKRALLLYFVNSSTLV